MSTMKTKRLGHALRQAALSIFAFALILAVAGCGSSSAPAGGGGGGSQPPSIATQPVNQTVTAGQTATFTVTATGTAPLSYQWQKNGVNISGGIAASYTTPATATTDTGSTFDVVVSNSAGMVTSASATLTVTITTAAVGWAFVQDSIAPTCGGVSTTTCHIAPLDMLPTVVNSNGADVWMVVAHTTNNVTISGVCTGAGCTGASAGWTACPNCHIAALGTNLDIWYNVTNTPAGTTDIIVTLSGASGSTMDINFVEMLPPPGFTALFDTSGAVSQSSCPGGVCTGVSLGTLGGTDLVFQTLHATNPTAWNACSSPYITDNNGNCVGLNVTSGAAPTEAVSPSQGLWSAIAFKSNAGSFTPPTKQYSVLNFTNSGPNGLACNPSCTLTIPPTGTGHLLYLESGTDNGGFVSSVSGGGTWVVPGACQINLVGSGGDAGHNFKLSGAYVLSSTSGATSLNIAMTGGANSFFAAWEVSSTSGAFNVDAPCNTATRPNTFNIQGVPLTITGTNDVAFQSVFCPGGVSTVTFYPQPRVALPGAGGQFFPAQAANAILTDTGSTVPIPFWPSANNKSTVVAGIAFEAH